MKTILIPTDFSKNAENALTYAVEIAKKENARLILLHAYQIDYPPSYVPYELIAEETEKIKKESTKHLQAYADKITRSANIKCELLSVGDFAVDAILNTIKEKGVDLVVMGTKGATGLSGVVFGGNTVKIIEEANCPVIAVPEKAVYAGIKKITYTTSYDNNDFRGLKKVVEIAAPFDAEINILHVSDLENSEEAKHQMAIFKGEVLRKVPYKNVSFQLISGKDIENVLEEFTKSGSTNMIVMSTRHRNLFDKLFIKNITKQLSYHTQIPLMGLHYTTKSPANVF